MYSSDHHVVSSTVVQEYIVLRMPSSSLHVNRKYVAHDVRVYTQMCLLSADLPRSII